MHSAKLLVATAFVSLFVCAVACNGYNGDESSGQTAARATGNPPGNNGTIKIQEIDANDEIPDNDPHVGCSFKIEFRGYDEGDLEARWELLAHPPSGTGQIVRQGALAIGEDPAGGANDLDGTVIVNLTQADLAGLTRQAQQGYHLKLSVAAEGTKGADVKNKTFWVDNCGGVDAGVDSGIDSGTSSSGGSSSGGSSSGGSSSGGSSSGGSSSGGSSSGGSSSGATW